MRVGVRDFPLYRRPRKDGRPVYYARFHNNHGNWTAGCSTGQTVRSLAEGWATEEVRRRQNEADQGKPAIIDITFAEFAGKKGRRQCFFCVHDSQQSRSRAVVNQVSGNTCLPKSPA